MRRLTAKFLLLAGLALALVSAVVAHLSRTVLDQEAFSARVVAALDRPAVSAFVAQQLADGVVAANRDLTGVRPVIGVLAQSLVRSAAFRALAHRAAREAHAIMFSEGAERVMLSVPDVGVLLRGALETVSPEVAQRVPENVRLAIETRLTGTLATRAVAALRTAARVRNLARAGVLAGLFLVALSLWLAPERRQGVLDAAIGLLAIAVLLAMLVPLGRAVLTGNVADPALRPVVGETWEVFAGGLRNWGVAIGIVAACVMAAVAALLEPARLRAVAGRGLRELAGQQPTRARELVRVLALGTLGAFAVASPLPTLSTLAVVAGVAVLAITVHAAVTLLAPPDAVGRGDAPPLRVTPALSVAVAVVGLVAVGLGALAAAPRLRSPVAASAAVGPVTTCNGAVELCERRLDEVTLAGAHNAMGSADNPSWMFPNQDVAIPQLLRLGVRALLVDVHAGHPVADRIKTDFESEEERRKFEQAIGAEAFAAAMRVRDRLVGEAGPGALYLCHGFCELGATPFDSALVQLRTFLVEHPGEVVLVVLEDYVPADSIRSAFERTALLPYVYSGPWQRPFPTLGEMVAQGRRLVVLGENHADTTSWYRPAYGLMQETPYTFHRPEDFSCRPNRGARGNPFFLMNHWIETTPAPKPSNAALVNAREALVARARECRRVRGRLPSVLAVDFAGIGDVVGAAALLNGLVPASDSAASSAGRR